MTTTNHTSPKLTDEQIHAIENDQAKTPGVTRKNLTVRTVRAALIAQHGFCLDEDHCTCAREFGYRVCQPSDRTSPIGEDAANVAIGENCDARIRKWRDAFDAMHRRAMAAEARAALTAEKVAGPKLSVMYGPMPESNGKTNWTAILHNGDIASGITLDRSEYPDRVRYEADRARWLIGELDKEPFILDYDADKHSGYVAPQQPAQPVAQTLALTDAARDVLSERQRQVTAEGWTPEHDDEHSDGEMALAASSYARFAAMPLPNARPSIWPWALEWWKPSTPRRNLVKAAALILAEIERIDRLAAQPASFLAEGGKQ